MAQSVIERMMRKTRKNDSGCWDWLGATNNAGYGFIRDEARYLIGMITVHRAMARHMGIDIYNNEIQHTCLNKLCVNPDHLTTGTPQDRTDRLIAKYGSKFICAKNPIRKCEVCGISTHHTWFNRKHKHCFKKN